MTAIHTPHDTTRNGSGQAPPLINSFDGPTLARQAPEALWLAGELVAATELVWAVHAPCGCVIEGLTAATDVRLLRTGDEARVYRHDGIWPLIERDRELGFTYVLTHRADHDRAMDDDTGLSGRTCPHNPYLGTPIVHPPAGYWWGTSDALFKHRRTYKRHLVPEEFIDHQQPMPGAALCGTDATIGKQWRGGSWLIETVPCRDCEQAALKIESETRS